MLKLTLFPCLAILFISSFLFAQDDKLVERFLDDLQTDEFGETDFLQILKDLEDRPIDVNSASVRELLRIPFLSYEAASAIIHYRNAQGRYSTPADLQKVSGISAELVQAISPYIRFQDYGRRSYFNYRAQAGEPLHDIRGYSEEGKYSNPLYLYQRVQWQPTPTFFASALWEKDAGEADWFDFGSFSLKYKWVKGKSEIQAGDFNLETGQRLVLSGPYGQAVAISNPALFTRTPLRWAIKTSVNENAFLRGGLWAFTPWPKSAFVFAYSNRKLDATLTSDSASVSSIYNSGYHRTESEIRKQNVLNEKIYSVLAGKEFSNFRAGLQFVRTEYSHPLAFTHNSFQPNLNYYSGFYSYLNGLLRLQGEAAFLDGKFPALQNSLFLKGENFRYGIVFYYYHPDYWAFHGRAFGSISKTPNNEQGYFLTFTSRPLPKSEIAAYLFFARPVRPTGEFSFLKRTAQVQLAQRYRRSLFTLRFTHRVREAATDIPVLEMKTSAIRFQIEEEVSPHLRFKQRIEYSWLNSKAFTEGDKTYGFSLYIDARYRIHKRFSIQGRWTQFDVPDYDLRLYEFENDLPGNFRNVLLNGRGYKWFLLLNYRFATNWNFAVKFQEMQFPDAETLGSGLDTVLGNSKQFVRAQLQVIY